MKERLDWYEGYVSELSVVCIEACIGQSKAQRALSTLRNLVSDEEVSVEVLVQNQLGGGPIAGEYRFPDWARVSAIAMGAVTPGEEVIEFRTSQLMRHEERRV